MPEVLSAKPEIFVAFVPLPPFLSAALESVVVDDHLHLPDSARITLHQKDGEPITFGPFRVGVPLMIKMSSIGLNEATMETIFTGEVTALEGDYHNDIGVRLVVQGYDKSHRLHAGRRTETYPPIPDSTIATMIASRNGLIPGEIDPTSGRIEEVSQLNLSDWDFLKARAREIGYECGVADGMLYFRKPKYRPYVPNPLPNPETPIAADLPYGGKLLEFRPRVTGVGQVQNVKARGWDFLTKQPTIGFLPPVAAQASPGITTTSPQVAAPFSPQDFLVASGALSTIPDAMAAAKGAATQINSALAEADGVCVGNTAIRAGEFVSISAVEQTFCGMWRVTSARHVYDDGKYLTHFVVSGSQDRSLLGLTSLGQTNGSAQAGGPPIFGVVVAQVVDLLDPLMLGRVKVKFPWLDANYKTDWCRLLCVGAGADTKGGIWYPEVDDEVLVAFEHGDSRRPYVIGQLYNGRDLRHKPAQIVKPDGKVGVRGFRSRLGHQITFFDEDITMRSGISIATSDGGGPRKMRIALKAGPNPIPEILIGSDGTITIKAKQKITVESDMAIDMKAPNITIEAQAALQLKGATANLEASGMTVVKGGTVMIN